MDRVFGERGQVVLYFFALFCLGSVSGLCSSSLASAAETDLDDFSLEIIIRRVDDSLVTSKYVFSCSLENIAFKDQKVDLSFSGYLKQDPRFSILEVDSGKLSVDSTSQEEFSLYAIYKNKLLTISYFQTRSFILKGDFDLSGKPTLDLELDIKGISLGKMNDFWGFTDFPFKGDFRGKVFVRGELNSVFIAGNLEAYKGQLEDYEFKKAVIGFKGTYPLVQFFDSSAFIEGRNLNVEGRLNLARLYGLPIVEIRRKETETDDLFTSVLDQELKEGKSMTLRGFLDLTPELDAMIYKLGTDSFLKLSIKDTDPSVLKGLEF